MNLVVYILDRFAGQNQLYTSWMDDCRFPVRVVETPVSQWTPPEDTGLVITHEHFRWETVATLYRVLQQQQRPVLILCDGILEFRNTWENPTIAQGSVYQTIFGHKLACLGRAPTRIIESFGNAGLCEIVGHPKFDAMLDADCPPVNDSGTWRLLVTTARTPAFNRQQHEQLVRGLEELRDRFQRNPEVADRPVEVTWRLTDRLLTELELPPIKNRHKLPSLGAAIDQVDAVITTPSTVYLESLIKNRPTAILDFTNSPSYISPAWRIGAGAHINPVLSSLVNPSAAKMLFQRTTLHDQLELDGNSKSRLLSLIQTMVDAGQVARRAEQPISLPTRVLSDPRRGIAKIDDEFDLATLFPNNPVFRQADVARLQQELAHAVARMEQLPREIHNRDSQLLKKTEHIQSLNQMLESAQGRTQNAIRQIDSLVQQQSSTKLILDKKNDHIQDLLGLVEQSHQQLKEVREKFRRRADVMVAVAVQLNDEVKNSTLSNHQPDECADQIKESTQLSAEPVPPEEPVAHQQSISHQAPDVAAAASAAAGMSPEKPSVEVTPPEKDSDSEVPPDELASGHATTPIPQPSPTETDPKPATDDDGSPVAAPKKAT